MFNPQDKDNSDVYGRSYDQQRRDNYNATTYSKKGHNNSSRRGGGIDVKRAFFFVVVVTAVSAAGWAHQEWQKAKLQDAYNAPVQIQE